MPLIRLLLLVTLFLPAIARCYDSDLKPCGTITKSIRLRKDCLGPMIIGADNVTVDLHGHTIRPGGLDDVDYRGGVEIFNRRGVTIKNGTIDGYDYGLLVIGGGGYTFRDLAITRGGAEEPENQVRIQDVDHTLVKRVTVTTFFDRLPFLFSGSNSEILQVKSAGYATSGASIVGNSLTIARNEFSSGYGSESRCGLFFRGERSTVRRNKLSTEGYQPEFGALCIMGTNNTIKDNTILGARTGLALRSSTTNNVIRNNYIRSNPDADVPDAVDIRAGDNACTNSWKSNNFLTDSEGDGPDAGCIR